MAASTVAPHLLDVIDHDILPMTEGGVAVGNKVFGAALLRKTDLSVVIAGTNAETDNPLLHGEVSTLNRFTRCQIGLRRATYCSCDTSTTSSATLTA